MTKEVFPYPELGLRIKEIRGKQSQTTFAGLVGSSQGTISKYEKGMAPDAIVLSRIAWYGHTSVEALIGEFYKQGMPLENVAEHSLDELFGYVRDIFESDDDIMKNALKSNILAFGEAVRRKKPGPKGNNNSPSEKLRNPGSPSTKSVSEAGKT